MLKTAFDSGGGRVTKVNNDTGTTSSITIILNNTNSYLIGDGDSVGSSNYGSGNSGATSNDSRDSEQGTHVVTIAGKIYSTYQIRASFQNSNLNTMNMRFAQTNGGTTSRYTSGTSSYTYVPLNYWNLGSSNIRNGKFTFVIRFHGHVNNTGSYQLMPHFCCTGGFTNSNGGSETVTTMGRGVSWTSGIDVMKNCVDRIKFFPYGGTVGIPSITIDAYSYEWLATDTQGT